MTDEDLLVLYATGVVHGMENLYHRHRSGPYSYIYNQVKDRSISADILQDVWSRFIPDTERIVSMIEDEALTFSLQAHLYRMARNSVIDHFHWPAFPVHLNPIRAHKRWDHINAH